MSDAPDSHDSHDSHQSPDAVAAETVETVGTVETGELLDLGAIQRDLDGVEHALGRLNNGTYWIDEVTGATMPDEFLAANPVARHA